MKKINMEFKKSIKAAGYTMRANINPEYIRALYRYKKESGVRIARAIKENKAKEAVKLIDDSKHYNRYIKEASGKHDKIIYLNGEACGIFEFESRKCFKFEK